MPPTPRSIPPAPSPRPRACAADYVELRARSAFSFLEGASNPEDLVDQATELGHHTLALGDLHGLYGAPRFQRAAEAAGIRPIIGAEVSVRRPQPHALTEAGAEAGAGAGEEKSDRLLLLVESQAGYRALSRLLTLGHDGRAKREFMLDWDRVEEHARDLCVLVRGDAGLHPALLDRARGVFEGVARTSEARVFVDVSRHLDRAEARHSRHATAIAEAMGVPVLASGDVRCAHAGARPLLDALTCLRWKTTLDAAGRRLLANAERHLQSPDTLVDRFADRPEWILRTRELAERCAFTLGDLGYRFPEYPLDPDERPADRLRALSYDGARRRYGHPFDAKVKRQLDYELRIIERLGLEGYFLIVHDIARFAREQRILCQGRGSAANSAVCYALGITAVDPVGMELLFERFLSEQRGEWPDIDLDLPSGDQRERVIQYVFTKYGEHGAAMTANVITYRIKMAVREMGKVVGLAPDTVDRLARQLSRLEGDDSAAAVCRRLAEAGLDARSPRIERLVQLCAAVQGLPRHLGQHSGGIVIAAGRLDEVVPIEPASMAGRRVVQWDKDDCADLGIIKIDLLGLGMLAALEETIPLIREHEGKTLDLAHLPKDDPATYDMICRADTIGVFQIESRAQMATLPRMKPRHFYDLVVEIAIIRPGPIVGQMVHPYLNRRAAREPVVYPHPSLEPILKRTLGVPIFQEQLLRVAMTAAGFSGGEAEELRRAMGFKRSVEKMERIEERLRAGMEANGFAPAVQDEVVRHITSFALYGFPESHSASFALIAYASAYLKCHHPAAFLVGLLNAQPMGFYTAATLIKDAQRHGVEVRAIDVCHSHWRSTLEPGPSGRPAVRIGLRHASGLREESAAALVDARARAPFENLADMVRRVPFVGDELDGLAELGALASLEGTPEKRRAALWQVAAIERDPTSLFAGQMPREEGAAQTRLALREMDAVESTLADYRRAGLTTGPQIMAHLRPALEARGLLRAADLAGVPDGRIVRTAGHVIVRQRPGSAKGFLFLTLEDETGLSNAVLTPQVIERFRVPLHGSALLEIAGPIQNVEGVIHIKLAHLAALDVGQLLGESRGGPGAKLPGARSYR